MGIKIANTAMELEIVPVNPPDVIQALITVLTPPSLVCKAGGLAIYKGDIALSIQNVVTIAPAPPASIPDPASVPPLFISATVHPTAQYVKSTGELVLREGDDTDVINATPKIPSSPTPIDYPIAFTVRVKTAGQNEVKAL